MNSVIKAYTGIACKGTYDGAVAARATDGNRIIVSGDAILHTTSQKLAIISCIYCAEIIKQLHPDSSQRIEIYTILSSIYETLNNDILRLQANKYTETSLQKQVSGELKMTLWEEIRDLNVVFVRPYSSEDIKLCQQTREHAIQIKDEYFNSNNEAESET